MLKDQIHVFFKGGKCYKEIKYTTEFVYLFICSLMSLAHYCVSDILIGAGDTPRNKRNRDPALVGLIF